MTNRMYGLIVLILAGGAVAAGALQDRSASQDKSAPAVPTAAQPVAKAEGAEAGIKASTAEYTKAFDAGDAKAAAALWTSEGEYTNADGEVQSGRAAIEKSLTEFFKANPKVTAEVQVETVRVLGRGTATAEGVVRIKAPGDDLGTESRYSALHVLEDGKWYAASVREREVDPATEVGPNAIEWLVGEWAARGENGEMKITYSWDENKVFLNSKYAISKDGKPVTSGTQVIGRNPDGGLRSWLFDSSGTTSEAVWVRDGTRWISEATGLLTDGTEITSINILVPIGPDAFTWQTTDRAANGVPLPALPPVKITRVKK